MIQVVVEIEGGTGWERAQVLSELMQHATVLHSRVLDVRTTYAVREPRREDRCES